MAETQARLILLRPAQIARFWSHVQHGDPWDCWPWLRYVNDEGYGTWTVRLANGQRYTFYAHRLAYALSREPIPPMVEAAHGVECVTRSCCNPDHLTPKSHRENMHDIQTRRALALSVGSIGHAQAH